MPKTRSAVKIKNVMFDWAGVINDNFYDAYLTINDIFRHCGVAEISQEEVRREWCQPYMKFYTKYIPDLPLEEEKKLFARYYAIHNTGHICEGMAEVLSEIKRRGFNMIILSSDPPGTIEELVKKYNLVGLFDEIYTDVHDKTAVVHSIIDRHNFKPEETIIIGDTPHEIETGKSCGIKTCAVTWGFKDEASLMEHNPDFIVRNADDLRQILLS